MVCTAGDIDGDAKADGVYLVPLWAQGMVSPSPAAVFVQRAVDGRIERPWQDGDADASALGRGVFNIDDRTGDQVAEVTFLTNTCTVSSCSARVRVETWDGTAWRDVGPADGGMTNVDRLTFEGAGATSVLTMHGGVVTAPGAGPARAKTVVYTFDGKRYQVASVTADVAVYLYHAIVDADAKFDAGDFAGAITAYQGAIADKSLKDWKAEQGEKPGRPTLESYALFRIALATAASGLNPNAALDAVITFTKDGDGVFGHIADEFRRGFASQGTTTAGCGEVTKYLQLVTADGDNPAYIRDVFYYGFANQPQKTFSDICPL